MYNNMYEEYIRNVLGYSSPGNMNCNNCAYGNNNDTYDYTGPMIQSSSNSELEEFYPEIYRIIYPMIRKACSMNTNLNTREAIEKMTDEIYNAIQEDDNPINVNINLGNNVQSSINTGNTANVDNRGEAKKENNTKENREQKETRRAPNRDLRDLIKILLIRELLGRPNFRPPIRPRPPMGRPNPGPGPRPPIMPRTNNQYNQLPYDIYEY